jgi:glucose-1-phosphate adenylyltransferase
MILAGGEGRRLEPLTHHRAKPAVPFGGKYRIIDIVLSNFVNSGVYHIAVLTQVKAESLIDHIETSWQQYMGTLAGHVTINPAQQRVSKDWYLGTADAVFQNFNRLEKVDPDLVAVFGGDHIYKMNVKDMVNYHGQRGADMTVAAISVPLQKAAKTYGVIEVDRDYNMIGFEEKPEKPKPVPGDPDKCLVSMGNYLFNRDLLVYAFSEDAKKKYASKQRLRSLMEMDINAREEYSTHDIGYDIIPFLHKSGLRISVYDFTLNKVPGVSGEEVGYWRDVGAIGEFYDANMDVCGITPIFNLYNEQWPVRSSPSLSAPAKFSLSSEVYNSIVSEGSIVTKSRVINSVIGCNVRMEETASVEFSVIFKGVSVGEGARLRRTIVDKYVNIPPGMSVGYDHEQDKKRGLTVAPSGITVVPKRFDFKSQ